MARRRTHGSTLRNRVVSIRLTDDEYAKRASEARRAGLTMSSLCEQLVNKGRVEAAPETAHRRMDPSVFVELRRIGNNANQIAHALNSNLPPDVQFAWRTARDLLQLFARQELQLQQVASERPRQAEGEQPFVNRIAEALNTRTPVNDWSIPQARDVFQKSVLVHPARRGQGHE